LQIFRLPLIFYLSCYELINNNNQGIFISKSWTFFGSIYLISIFRIKFKTMPNSKPHFVIAGYPETDKTHTGYTKVLTTAGETLLIQSTKIAKSFPIELSNENGLKRFFIEEGASIWLGVSADIIQKLNPGVSNIGDSTVLKYYDDGSTISKSRDDNFTVGSQL
jgi:hypothetical protein